MDRKPTNQPADEPFCNVARWCSAEWLDGKSGDIYEGQKKDGVPHGYGIQIQSSSEMMYEGQVRYPFFFFRVD